MDLDMIQITVFFNKGVIICVKLCAMNKSSATKKKPWPEGPSHFGIECNEGEY